MRNCASARSIKRCATLRPQHRNHVWSYDFVEDRTHDGRRYRILNVLDEFSHECLTIRVAQLPFEHTEG
jgi:hypothetical protein